jgi:hypothetical protein
VSADEDQWLESLPDDEGFASCDLHATSGGLMSCFELLNGFILATQTSTGLGFQTFNVVVESSTS